MAVGDDGGEELAVILDGVFGEKWFVVAGGAGVVRTGHVLGGEDGLHAWFLERRGDVEFVEGGVGHLGEDGVGVEGAAIESDVVSVEGVAGDVADGGLVGVGELGGGC